MSTRAIIKALRLSLRLPKKTKGFAIGGGRIFYTLAKGGSAEISSRALRPTSVDELHQILGVRGTVMSISAAFAQLPVHELLQQIFRAPHMATKCA